MHDTEERNPKKSRAGSCIVITANEAYTAQAITSQTETIQADKTLVNRESLELSDDEFELATISKTPTRSPIQPSSLIQPSSPNTAKFERYMKLMELKLDELKAFEKPKKKFVSISSIFYIS